MRVLFSAHGAHGHVLPMLGLARALVAGGNDVLFAVPGDMSPALASGGIDTAAAGMTDADAVAAARARWPEATTAPAGTWTPRMFAEIAAPAMVRDLEPLLSEWRPDLIVREQGEHGAPVAAARAGIPWVTHGWGAPLPDRSALAQLSDLVRPVWRASRLPIPGAGDLYGAAVLDPCPASLYAGSVFAAGRHAIRPDGVVSAPRDERSPSRRHAYVGFGTVPLFRHPEAVLETVVVALLDLDFDVTVTVADAELARRLRAHGPRVHVAEWVDLTMVLPVCDLVVCHGGAGTTLAALSASLPLLSVPRGAPSQERMAAACERRGVGRAADGSDLAGLRHALREVTSDPAFANAAATVAAEIAAMPAASAAIPVLERVVAEGRTR